MKDKDLVLAIFENEPKADGAVEALKTWDKSNDMVKLGAVGVLVLDENGEVKTQKLGKRSVSKGAAIGLVLGMLTPVGIAAAAVGGGALGALHRKGLGMNDEERDHIAEELSDGKAAVGVLTTHEEAPMVEQKLKELGGQPEVHGIESDAVQQAAEQMGTTEAPTT
jgi:uncharacterized membrane protein